MTMPEHVRTLDTISGGFQRAQVLHAALAGGVFDQLKTPKGADEVAQALAWDGRNTRILLNALVALDLIGVEAGKYSNAPIAEACLVEGAPQDQRHIITHRANSYAAYAHLGEVVASGSAVERGERSPEQLRAFICGMKDIAKESARAMVEALDLSAYKKSVDLGGGPGTYTIAMLEAHPGMTGTIFDLPDVVRIGKEQVQEAGLTDRVSFIEGDMTQDPIGGGYDLALVSNIIHSFGPEENQALVHKCYEALEPGGMLIIKDFLLEDDRGGPAFGLMFAVHMMMHTTRGDTYTRAEVEQWCANAGFSAGECRDLTPQTRLWLATK